MPSTYAHNAIGGETEETKGTEKEKVGKTVDGREKTTKTTDRREEAERVDRTADGKEKARKTADRQVKERARVEMFLTVSPLPSRSMIQLVAYSN